MSTWILAIHCHIQTKTERSQANECDDGTSLDWPAIPFTHSFRSSSTLTHTHRVIARLLSLHPPNVSRNTLFARSFAIRIISISLHKSYKKTNNVSKNF